MNAHVTELVISTIHIIDYRMPLKRPYGTARGVTRGSKNFLIRLFGQHADQEYEGVGEAQPRHRLTGDISHETAWAFLQNVRPALHGRSLNLSSNRDALNSVREVMADLNDLAHSHSEESNMRKPFRGTLLGIEVALLDLVSRAMRLPLSKVLGEERDKVAITVSTLSTQNSFEEFRRRVERQTRFPMVRVKGKGDFDGDTKLLSLVHEANKSVGYVKPIWMDLNEGFDEQGAFQFIEYVASQMSADELPEIITLEQPIPGIKGDRLPHLQKKADELTAAYGAGEIRIMPDECLWDIEDLDIIHVDGGCRAMNIKTAKAGGLLASLDLARRAVEIKPATNICIGGMIGTSDITTWSLLSLAKALPRLDYITAVPPGNVKQRISDPLTKFEARGSNIHRDSEQNGIGAKLDLKALKPYIRQQNWFPEGSDFVEDEKFEQRSVVEIPGQSEESFCVLFLGDFHFGESYKTGGGTVLAERGYKDGTKYLKAFVDRADFTIANLETPVVDPAAMDSPFEGKKRFLHWADPTGTPSALKNLGIDAVSLANNHTLDYGRTGLSSSLQALRGAGIKVFGAGENLASAKEPLRIDLPKNQSGGTVNVYGSMLGPRKATTGFDSYANESQSGCAPLSESLPSGKEGTNDPFTFNVAFPHWGANYNWRTLRQRSAAREVLSTEVDLIIGHGAHCLQEFGRYRGKWVAYGIGNSHFQAQGRYEAFVAANGILPFSFWTMLMIQTAKDGSRQAIVRFYPVRSDNRRTDFQPLPVTKDDFEQILQTLYQRDARHFDSERVMRGSDDLGYFLQIGVKTPEARVGKSSTREGLSQSNSPPAKVNAGESVLTSDERLVALVKRGRTLGTQLIADRAADDGATTQWFGGATCILSWEDKRVLLQGNRGLESAVGAGIIKDKYLTKTFLQKGGARAPEGNLASCGDEAVEILHHMGRPLVVTPRAGDRGRAITVNVDNAENLKTAFDRADADSGGGVLVEEFIQGEEFRCLVTDGECLSVVKRTPASVVGDGESTLRQLIEQKNHERRQNPGLYRRLLTIGAEVLEYLDAQNMSLDSVPEKESVVTVNPVGNVSHGADPAEVLDVTSEDLKQTAVRAARSIPGMKWAGVDVVVSDESGLAYVLEVNSNSGIGSHHFPIRGEAKDIAGRIWNERRVFAKSGSSIQQDVPAPHDTPIDLGMGRVRLAELLRASVVEDMQLAVEYLGGGTYQISKDGSAIEWLRGCTTTRDLSAVGSVLARHGAVRRIIESSEIPLTAWRRVRSQAEFTSVAAELGGPIQVTGYLRPWEGLNTLIYPAVDVEQVVRLLRKSGSVVAQQVPDGSRLKVVATRNRVSLVLREGVGMPISPDVLAIAGKTAVQAVRAVPELRWAAVDVVVGESDGTSLVRVEGLSQNPVLAGGPIIIAGSVRDFCSEVIVAR